MVVAYMVVAEIPPWTVGAHVMRRGDGNGAVVATLGSEAGSCTGTVEGAAVGEGTGNVTYVGICATLVSVAGGGVSGLVGGDGDGMMGEMGTGGCSVWSLKIVASWVS
jgi:hypothetical protein